MPQSRQASVFPPSALVAILRDGHPRSISEIAATTGLSRSTVKQRLDEVLRAGLVAPTGEAVTTGGRPSARFQLNGAAWPIIGIDLGATHCLVGILDLFGNVQAWDETPIDIAEGPHVLLEHAAAQAENLLARHGVDRARVAAIGIGLPGPIEHGTGRPVDPPIMPGWHNYDVPGHLADRLGAPTLVDNDVNIAALGEHTTAWPRTSDLLYVKVGTGIGAGIIAHGTLQRGAQGTAGDIGHVRVAAAANRPCRCGNTGCLEAEAGGAALLRELRGHGKDVSGLSGIHDLADRGDIITAQLLRNAGRMIGEVLTTCVSLLNPSVIVAGGAVAQAGEHLVAGIREVVYTQAQAHASRELTISRAKTGRLAALIGASVLAADHILSHDSVQHRVGNGR